MIRKVNKILAMNYRILEKLNPEEKTSVPRKKTGTGRLQF